MLREKYACNLGAQPVYIGISLDPGSLPSQGQASQG